MKLWDQARFAGEGELDVEIRCMPAYVPGLATGGSYNFNQKNIQMLQSPSAARLQKAYICCSPSRTTNSTHGCKDVNPDVNYVQYENDVQPDALDKGITIKRIQLRNHAYPENSSWYHTCTNFSVLWWDGRGCTIKRCALNLRKKLLLEVP